MIINYTKEGRAFSDFDIEQNILEINNKEELSCVEQTINCSTQNVLFMSQVLRKKNIIKKVTLLFEGNFICEVNKSGQVKSDNKLPDGFHDFFERCLDDLLDISRYNTPTSLSKNQI